MRADPVPSAIECTTSPSSAKNVLLDCPNDASSATNETPIAVDPADPLHVVAGAIDFGACCSEFYTTFDGGMTWTSGDMATQDPGRLAGDPAISFDVKHGTVIFSQLSVEFAPNLVCDSDDEIAVSVDGGLHWGPSAEVFGGTGCFGEAPMTFFDKPWIATDNHPSSPHYGRTYLVASEVICTKVGCDTSDGSMTWTIIEGHSDDGGYTWTAPQVISGSDPTNCTAQPNPPACDNAGGASPAISPDGSVHVAFVNVQHEAAWQPGECCENQYLVVNSTDGGATWSDPSPVVDLEDGTRDYPDCVVSTGSAFCPLTGTAIVTPAFGEGNLAASSTDGTLYLVFSDNRNGIHDSDHPITNTDVFVMTSANGGTTWSGPDVVSDAPGDQFFPFADVNPVTGKLGVLFYDRSSDPSQLFDVTLATGLPGSFSSTRITTESSHFDKNLWFPTRGVRGCEQCAGFIGDYLGLAYGSDGAANMAWTDLRRRVSVPKFGNGYTENTFYAKA